MSSKSKSSGAELVIHSSRGPRRLALSKWAFLGLALAVVLCGTWAAALTSYVLFRDEFLADMLERNAQLQRSYDVRVEAVKAEAARAQSRALVEKASLDRALAALTERQAQLERRHALLTSLAGEDQDTAATLPAPAAPVHNLARPRPIGENGDAATVPGRQSQLVPADQHPALLLADRLGALDRAQSALIASLQQRIDERRFALRDVHESLGLRSTQIDGPSGIGGPFVAASPVQSASFDRRVTQLIAARADLDSLENGIARLPIRKPLARVRVASPFGVRPDPFFHITAYHTGLDLEAGMGERVRATAAGRITIAGVNGGYGLMVEVDHGDGLATRYGHLSAIDVTEGMEVQSGTVIGRVGSTGRSTGPHLHYETRVRNEAVNPERFLAAGRRLAGFEDQPL
jgi:murein DD-endopeptidase MepM/ murein hydrolase activator NlpD